MRTAVLAVLMAASVALADPPKPTADRLAKALDAVAGLTDAQAKAAKQVFADALDAGKKAKTPTELKKVAGEAWGELTAGLEPTQVKKVHLFLDQWAKARAEKVQRFQAESLADARGDQAESARDAQLRAQLKKADTPAEKKRIQDQISRDKKDDQKEKASDKKRVEAFQKRVPNDDLFDVLLQMKTSAPRASKPSDDK